VKGTAIGVVVAGLALALLLGLEYGFDPAAVVILACLAAVGALAIAVARRSGTRVSPAHCAECRGVISRHAPFCKHCGAPTDGSAGARPSGR
jgi:predicted amidophosphoribosyltransferase